MRLPTCGLNAGFEKAAGDVGRKARMATDEARNADMAITIQAARRDKK